MWCNVGTRGEAYRVATGHQRRAITGTMAPSVEMAKKTLRQATQDLMAKHQYQGAIFMASKLSLVSGYAPKDVFLLTNAMYLAGEYARCHELLESRGLIDVDVRFRLLAAQCLAAQKLWDECVVLLDEAGVGRVEELKFDAGGAKMASALCAILAKAYEMLESFEKSTMWYKAAVAQDPMNCEAFSLLMRSGRLSEAEEVGFVDGVVSRLPEGADWMKDLYTTMLSGRSEESVGRMKVALRSFGRPGGDAGRESHGGHGGHGGEGTPIAGTNQNKMETRSSRRRQQSAENKPAVESPSEPGSTTAGGLAAMGSLLQDSDVVASRATLLARQGRYHEAYALAKSLLDRDLYDTRLLPVYLSIAVKLKKRNDVFVLGHKLMEKRPDDAESWYAAGCYYYLTEQYSSARNFFGKATSLNKMFFPAWIGFAHSFACMDETDQAMAAYRTASRLFPGLPQPVIGMALEYARMNNLGLAQKLCSMAYQKNPHDPAILLEAGVIAYRNARYGEALKLLKNAVDAFDDADEDREVALVNLGHCYRKIGMYEQSVDVLTRALALDAYQPGTYSALAYAHHLAGDPISAVDAYHKALSLRPEDPFAISMLEIALEESEPLTLDRLVVAGGDSTTTGGDMMGD